MLEFKHKRAHKHTNPILKLLRATQADKFATFVVMLPNDNFQWTFKLRCSFPK